MSESHESADGDFVRVATCSTPTEAHLLRGVLQSPGPLVIFRASFVLSFITVVWYFLAGQQQSRQILAMYGPKYKKKSLVVPAVGCASVWLVSGWALGEFL